MRVALLSILLPLLQCAPRFLATSPSLGPFTQDELSSGYVTIYILGVFYLAGIIYILYSRFINAIIEDLVYMIDSENEVLRPVVYSALNGGLPLLGCLVSLFMEQPSMGVAQVVGMDALNIFYLFASIVHSQYYKHEVCFDRWTLLRDAFFYSVGLSVLVLAYLRQTFAWYMGVTLIVYYLLFYMSISHNDSLKEFVLKALGIVKEDDDFNSEEHFKFKRRRTSITVCNLSGCIPENTDAMFSIKLNRLNALLKVAKPDPKDFKVYFDFQRIVYKVIYSLRNHTKLEKVKRAELIHSITNKKKKRPDQSGYKYKPANSFDEDISNINEDKQEIHMPQKEHESQEDLHLIHKISHPQEPPAQQEPLNCSYGETEENQKFMLTWPQTGKKDQAMFLVYYPVLLVLQLLPDHKKQPSLKKLIFSTLISFGLLVVLVVLVEHMTHYMSKVMFLKQNCLAMLPLALLFNAPFMNYNSSISTTDSNIDFMQSFMHLAIFKVGMVVGPTWLLASFRYSSVQMGFHDSQQTAFGYALLALLICYLVSLICTLFNAFKIDRKLAKFHFIIFFLFVVSTFLLIQM